MAKTDQEGVEARLRRLRELRDRGPAAGSPDESVALDPEATQGKRDRLRQVRERTRAQGDATAAAPGAAPPARGAAAGGGDRGRQMAGRFLEALRGGGGASVPGTPYTEEGIARFLGMLKETAGKANGPFFERLYTNCTKQAEDGERMFGEANLTSLARTVELLERIQSQGIEAMREQLGGRGAPGMFADRPGGGAGRPGGAGGFGGLRGQGGGGPGGPGGGFLRRPDGAGAAARRPGGTSDAGTETASVRELNERIEQLEKTIRELKAALEKRS